MVRGSKKNHSRGETRFVKAHVTPGARRDALEILKNGTFKISVKEKPDGGRANDSVRALIARHMARPIRAVSIARGTRSRHKLISINE